MSVKPVLIRVSLECDGYPVALATQLRVMADILEDRMEPSRQCFVENRGQRIRVIDIVQIQMPEAEGDE